MFVSLATLLVLPFIAHSVLAQDPPCTRQYTVKEGDICDSISKEQNVSTYQLAAANPFIEVDCNNLTPGQVLCLGRQGQDCTTVHVVEEDDTCDEIEKASGIDTTTLLANNPQLNDDCDIYIGEVLCTAKDIITPIPASDSNDPDPKPSPPVNVAPEPEPTEADSEDEDEDLPFCDEL